MKTCLLDAHNRRRLQRWWRARVPLYASERPFYRRPEGLEPIRAEEVYHVLVQPCYDRKIEAARPNFEVPGVPGVKEAFVAV